MPRDGAIIFGDLIGKIDMLRLLARGIRTISWRTRNGTNPKRHLRLRLEGA
jgi:hypothetical protein